MSYASPHHWVAYMFADPNVRQASDVTGVVHETVFSIGSPAHRRTVCIQLWADLEPIVRAEDGAPTTCIACVARRADVNQDLRERLYGFRKNLRLATKFHDELTRAAATVKP